MSFSNLPSVDEKAKASTESVLAVKSIFSPRKGFISRNEDPDYGSDLNVELIKDGSSASGKKFPIQIKSSGNVSFIKVEATNFLSIQFSTSRLNYLCSQPPAYGLIVIYDDSTTISYYDYVEEIVNRITYERNSEDWKNNETVAIHVPKDNILNDTSAACIHQKFLNRFEAHDLLIKKDGDKYDIPSFSVQENENGIKNLSPAQLIQKYGLMLLNDYDVLLLYQLLAQVSFHEVISSKALILTACIVYSEMGKTIEAEFYLNKAAQIIEEYNDEEREILKFTQIKVDFLLGKRDKNAYHQDLKELKELTKNPYNELQIKINLFYYSILDQVTKNEFNENIEPKMMEVFSLIDKTDLPATKKHLFKIYQAENVHMYISSLMLKSVNRIRLRESLNEPVSENEKAHLYLKANTIIYFLSKIIIEALNYAKETDNKLIKAHSNYILGRFFFTREYDFLILDFKGNNPELNINYKRAFLESIVAHNLFLQLGLLKEARNALINAYDLNRLAKLWRNLDITSDENREEIMINNLRASEKEMGLQDSYQSIVDKNFEDLKVTRSKTNQELYKDLSDNEIEKYARNVQLIYKLPEERLIHIINEMKAYRFYYKECKTEDFELLSDLTDHQSAETKYARPTKYILISKRTGMESLPSTNVHELAKAFGAIKSK